MKHLLVSSVSCHHWNQRLYQGGKPIVLLYYILVIPNSPPAAEDHSDLSSVEAALCCSSTPCQKAISFWWDISWKQLICRLLLNTTLAVLRKQEFMGEHTTPQGQGREPGFSLSDQPRSLICTEGSLGWSPAPSERMSGVYVIRNIQSSQPDQQPAQCTGQSLEVLISN